MISASCAAVSGSIEIGSSTSSSSIASVVMREALCSLASWSCRKLAKCSRTPPRQIFFLYSGDLDQRRRLRAVLVRAQVIGGQRLDNRVRRARRT